MDINDLICFAQGRDGEDSSESEEVTFSPNLSLFGSSPPCDFDIEISDESGRNVRQLLENIFSNKESSSLLWVGLPNSIRKNLVDLLRRKFNLNDETFELKLLKYRKRSEEECKFVVKKAMKALSKNFKLLQKESKFSNRSDSEAAFYEYYFADVAQKNNELLDYYYLPGCKLQKQSDRLFCLDKTVSFMYLQKILSSEKFKVDFLQYLLVDFKSECLKLRKEKLNKLAQYLISGKKLRGIKLPWSDFEIQTAYDRLTKHLTQSL